jgi:hypothetical protein
MTHTYLPAGERRGEEVWKWTQSVWILSASSSDISSVAATSTTVGDSISPRLVRSTATAWGGGVVLLAGAALLSAASRKRRRPIGAMPAHDGVQEEEEPQQGDDPTATRALFAELDERGTTSELENLALNIQGLGKRRLDGGEKQGGHARSQQQRGFETAELTDDFFGGAAERRDEGWCRG